MTVYQRAGLDLCPGLGSRRSRSWGRVWLRLRVLHSSQRRGRRAQMVGGDIFETEMTSFWWNFHHWLHRKLSYWQLSVQPVMKISSKWQHFCCSDISIWHNIHVIATLCVESLEVLKVFTRYRRSFKIASSGLCSVAWNHWYQIKFAWQLTYILINTVPAEGRALSGICLPRLIPSEYWFLWILNFCRHWSGWLRVLWQSSKTAKTWATQEMRRRTICSGHRYAKIHFRNDDITGINSRITALLWREPSVDSPHKGPVVWSFHFFDVKLNKMLN